MICSGLMGVKVQGITELSATPTGSPAALGVSVAGLVGSAKLRCRGRCRGEGVGISSSGFGEPFALSARAVGG